MIKKIIHITLLTFLITACSSNKNWEKARVIFYDDFEKEMSIKAGKHSYYNFVKAKDDSAKRRQLLIPEEVKLVESPNQKYIRMFFDEETYGMDSYSFGHLLAGDSVMLVQTKYQVKTCACKTAGTYFKDYFLVYNDSILKIKTDNKNNVYNRGQIYQFVDIHLKTGMPQDINTIDDIIFFLENINN